MLLGALALALEMVIGVSFVEGTPRVAVRLHNHHRLCLS
jgi:hypothetical protein